MYIRIQDNSLRFRVSQEEARSLLDGQVLSHHIALSTELNLKYSIQITTANNEFSFDASLMEFKALVNDTILASEISERPTKKGIVLHQGTSSEEPKFVSLEVDVKKIRK